MAKETTTTAQIDLSDAMINDILGTPGVSTESIMTTEDGKEEEKPSFFSKNDVATKVLDSAYDLKDEKPKVKEEVEKPIEQNVAAVNEVLGVPNAKETEEEEGGANVSQADIKKAQKLNKGTMVNVIKKMVDEGKLFEFEGDTPLEEYTVEDLEQLLEANLHAKEEAVAGNISKEFWQSLPKEIQYVGKYLADGGTDLKDLFRALSQTEEVKQITIDDERGQEMVCREYLNATGFGDAEDIEEEINAWKDRGELENKAAKFKPKLDAMQEQVVAQKLQQQESIKRQRDAAAREYMENLAGVLDQGEISGIKLDRKTQNFLWSGLLENNYPSVSGRPTNLFGHLIEKYQYVEPRHDLIAEALWLLADPDSYKNKIRQQGSNTQAEKTVRMLKIEQANKNGASVRSEEEAKPSRQKSQPKISRNNFFKRY